MNTIRNIVVLLLVMVMLPLSVQAKCKAHFMDILKEHNANKHSVSISIKSVDSGKSIYNLNDKTLISPASVQKILTTVTAAEVLGKDYEFRTGLYSRGEHSYVLKLNGDPYLSSKDLKTLAGHIEKGTEHIYIDDSILDNKTWGEGWQWDDDLNICMPKFGAYNLDNNIIKLMIMPAVNGDYANIVNSSAYPLVFFNTVITSNTTDIKVDRDISMAADSLKISGTVAKPTKISIPINNIQYYFNFKLTQTLGNRNVYIKEPFTESRLQKSDVKIAEVNHSLNQAIDDILKNSNNMIAETVFKLAGGKYLKATGSDQGGIKAFKNYCARNNLDDSSIRIVDGSGVSKNNLVTADFITNFLVLNKNNPVLEKLPTPGEGTLDNRLMPLKTSLRAKTGTLADISSIAGYLTSKKGKKYAFCIIINDTKLSPSDKKMVEDYILREAYIKL